jgi:hypothetical protein
LLLGFDFFSLFETFESVGFLTFFYTFLSELDSLPESLDEDFSFFNFSFVFD